MVFGLQQGFRKDAAEIHWAAHCLDTKKAIVSGILLAICATASYLLVYNKVNFGQIRESMADRLGFLDEPY
jgi:hypothetical protein